MSGIVNTKFAGETAPEDQESRGSSGVIIALAFFLFSPITALSAVATWLAFSWGRIRRSVIAYALGIYLFFTIWFIGPLTQLFIGSWVEVFPKILNQEIDPLPGVLLMVVQQIPLGIPLGITGGLIYSTWRWITRPVWNEVIFRRTPWELFALKRNIQDIREDKNGPENGTTLGVTDFGKKAIQSDQEAAAHTLVIGAAGSGKTTTLMAKARDAIRRGQGVVFVDLKGGNDVPEILSKFAQRYDRKFTHWLMQSKTEEYKGPDPLGPAYYDPLARGEATRRKDLLIASRNWSEEHYKIQASSYLQMLFSILIGNPKKDTSTFADVVTLLDPLRLQERAIQLGSNAAYQDIVAGIDALNDTKISKTKLDAIEGLRSQLEVILHSVAGPWLQVDTVNNHNINLKKAAHTGEIIVFSLDSSNYQELSALVANLIIQDLKTVSSELRDDPTSMPFLVFIDEFSAIGSDNIVGLINKSRDANMPVVLATQALGDLRKVDPTFLDQILGIINSFIIHRANTEDDAKVYAGLSGTTVRKKFRQAVEHSASWFGLGRGAGTGSGTVEDIEEFRVLPTEIQELPTGRMVYVTKSPLRIERVQVIPEANVSTGYGKGAPSLNLREIKSAMTVQIPSSSNSNFGISNEDGNDLIVPNRSDPEYGGSILNTRPKDQKPDLEKMKRILNRDPEILLPKSPTQETRKLKLAPLTSADFRQEPIDESGRPKFPIRPGVTLPPPPVKPVKQAEFSPRDLKPPTVIPNNAKQNSSSGEKITPKTPKPPKKDEFEF